MAELFITLPDGRTLHHRLTERPADIGRDASCEITVEDPSTSRRHARFTPANDGFVVEDLGSRNGTLVNDQPCTRAPLKDGDRILIGATLAIFRGSGMSSQSSVVIEDGMPTSHATRYVPKDQRLALSQRRLEMIYELSERLTTLQSQDTLLEEALSICFETLHFERGAVGLRRPGGRTVDWPVVHNLHGAEGELTISRSLFSRALEHGERAMFTDDGSAPVDPTVSMVQHGIRSAMCVPLLQGNQVLGVIYGDRTSTSTSYTSEDMDFFAAIARQISIGLVNSRLLEEQRKMARLSHDIDLARGIQQGLFPTTLPDDAELAVAASNDPGRRVSGDYYDVIRRDDGRIWVVVADVTGEGVAAAILMASLQSAVRVTIGETDDPGALLSRWNELAYNSSDRSRFITCLLVLVNPTSHRVDVASAGHWAPVVVRADGSTPSELEIDAGYPLGVVEDAQFETTSVDLGDDPFLLFCYTDGVTEALNTAGDPYGRERLIQALADRTDLNPKGVLKHIRQELATFVGTAEQSDDITMLTVRVG